MIRYVIHRKLYIKKGDFMDKKFVYDFVIELLIVLILGTMACLFVKFNGYLASKSIKEKPPVKKGKKYTQYMDLLDVRKMWLFEFYVSICLCIGFLICFIFHVKEATIEYILVSIILAFIGMLGNVIILKRIQKLK